MKHTILFAALLFSIVASAQNFSTSFETAPGYSSNYPPTGFSGISPNVGTGTFAISGEFAATGTKSGKFTIRNSNNDTWQYLKCELNFNYLPAGAYVNTTARNRSPWGMRYVKFKILVPPYNIDNSVCGIAVNVKEVNDNYPTATQMTYEDNVFYANNIEFTNSALTTYNYPKTSLGAFSKGVWYEYILERNYRGDASGIVRWHKKVGSTWQTLYSYNGPNWRPYNYTGTTPHYSKEAYLNIGIYKWAFRNDWFEPPVQDSVSIFLDDLEIYDSTYTLDQVKGISGAPNSAPTVSVSNPPSTVSSSISIPAVGNDIDGTIASYSWTQQSGPNTATLSGQTTSTLNVSGMVNGTYVFKVTVTDNLGATGEALVTVVKIPGEPAVVTIGDGGWLVNETSAQANVTVSGNGPFTYSWRQVSGKSYTASSHTVLEPVFSDLRGGKYVWQLDVTDANGLVTSKLFELKVRVTISKVKIKPAEKISVSGQE